MKVLLLQHIKGVGQKGEIKDVSEGYFRNMLSPRKLASPAQESQIRHLKNQAAKATEKLEAIKESAESVKAKIDGKSIWLQEAASDSGKLYAAVSAKEVAEGLNKELKVQIPVKSIKMKESIKQAGDFPVKIELYKGVSAEINVHVTSE